MAIEHHRPVKRRVRLPELHDIALSQMAELSGYTNHDLIRMAVEEFVVAHQMAVRILYADPITTSSFRKLLKAERQ